MGKCSFVNLPVKAWSFSEVSLYKQLDLITFCTFLNILNANVSKASSKHIQTAQKTDSKVRKHHVYLPSELSKAALLLSSKKAVNGKEGAGGSSVLQCQYANNCQQCPLPVATPMSICHGPSKPRGESGGRQI